MIRVFCFLTSSPVDIGRRHKAQRVYRKQLMYYTISHSFIGIPGIIVAYSFPPDPFYLKEKKTPLNKAPHNPDFQSSLRLCIYLLSQTADHLESIPIFKQRLVTGVVWDSGLHI